MLIGQFDRVFQDFVVVGRALHIKPLTKVGWVEQGVSVEVQYARLVKLRQQSLQRRRSLGEQFFDWDPARFRVFKHLLHCIVRSPLLSLNFALCGQRFLNDGNAGLCVFRRLFLVPRLLHDIHLRLLLLHGVMTNLGGLRGLSGFSSSPR